MSPLTFRCRGCKKRHDRPDNDYPLFTCTTCGAVSELHAGGKVTLYSPRTVPKCKRGFASMERDKLMQIAIKGGIAGQALGRSHRFNSDSGREAGRKGGLGRAKQLKEGRA